MDPAVGHHPAGAPAREAAVEPGAAREQEVAAADLRPEAARARRVAVEQAAAPEQVAPRVAGAPAAFLEQAAPRVVAVSAVGSPAWTFRATRGRRPHSSSRRREPMLTKAPSE